MYECAAAQDSVHMKVAVYTCTRLMCMYTDRTRHTRVFPPSKQSSPSLQRSVSRTHTLALSYTHTKIWRLHSMCVHMRTMINMHTHEWILSSCVTCISWVRVWHVCIMHTLEWILICMGSFVTCIYIYICICMYIYACTRRKKEKKSNTFAVVRSGISRFIAHEWICVWGGYD